MEPNKSKEESFYNWLSGRVSSKQLSECYVALKTVNMHYQQRGLIGSSIFETDDLTVLKSILRDISKGETFKRRYPKKYVISKLGLTSYIQFIEEQLQKYRKVDENKTEREKGIKETSNYASSNKMKCREDFYKWLLQSETLLSANYILKDLDLINTLLKKHGAIKKSVYDINNESELNSIINVVKRNEVIRIGISKKHKNYISALETYLEYLVQSQEIQNTDSEIDDFVGLYKKSEKKTIAEQSIEPMAITEKAIALIRITDHYKAEKKCFQEWLRKEKYKEGTINIYTNALEKGSQKALLKGVIREEILLMTSEELTSVYYKLCNSNHLSSVTTFKAAINAFYRYKKASVNIRNKVEHDKSAISITETTVITSDKKIDSNRLTEHYREEKQHFQEWLRQERYKEGTINIYTNALEKGSRQALLDGAIHEELLLMSSDGLRDAYLKLYNNKQLSPITTFKTVLGAYCRYKNVNIVDNNRGDINKGNNATTKSREVFSHNDQVESKRIPLREKADAYNSTEDGITEYLIKEGIPFIDNRPKGGALWIGQDSKSADFIEEYRMLGIEFKYSSVKHQWWTRDTYFEKNNVQEDNLQEKTKTEGTIIEEFQSNTTLKMESQLYELLKEEQYALLRNALIKQGVYSLQSFEDLNLWVFMNRYRLYSRNQRYAIYDQLKKRVEQLKPSVKGYQLKTSSGVYSGSSPAEALLHYCEYISQKAPLSFRSLIDSQDNVTGKRVLKKYSNDSNSLQLNNPKAYIDGNLDSETALRYAKYICAACKDIDLPVALSKNHETAKRIDTESPHNVVSDAKREERQKEDKTNVEVGVSQSSSPKQVVEIQHTTKTQKKVEQLVLNADIDGLTLEQLHKEIPSVSMIVLKQICENSPKIVDMQNKLVHVDAFIDFEDAADELHELIEKLLNKNDGYVSASQLYEYAHSEMQMFLNDNDVDDERSVYCIARHLFNRVKWNGYRYTFTAGNHISRSGKDALYTNMDVIRKYAQDNGGFFEYDGLVHYLEKVGIKTGNLRGQMQIGIEPYFFYYSSDDIITSESMHIDGSWLNQSQKALTRLFEDMGDHVVLRSINPIWYEQLPDLPGHRSWTPLLLQYVLRFYGKKVGARTIGTELAQRYDTVHSMLVSSQSEIQTFGDTVIAYIVDNGIEQRHFEAEQLRRVLVLGGMITGGELFSHLPKAIGNDPRFAWDVAGKNVNIKV